jgi:hypothetical protein
VSEPGHGPTQERLRGVDGTVRAEHVDRGGAARTEVGLVVDEDRGAELCGQLHHVAAPEVEASVLVDGGRVGQQ